MRKRKINDFFTPLSKKRNIVTNILHARDGNIPETVVKKELKDIKLIEAKKGSIKINSNVRNSVTPVIKTELIEEKSIAVSSPTKKSKLAKPSSQDLKVLKSLGKFNLMIYDTIASVVCRIAHVSD